VSEQTCKTCKWLDVAPDRAGRRVVRRGYMYRCKFPLPDLSSVLPLSLTGSVSFRFSDNQKSWVEGERAGCPVHSAKVQP
jgi:hypothetical protein